MRDIGRKVADHGSTQDGHWPVHGDHHLRTMFRAIILPMFFGLVTTATIAQEQLAKVNAHDPSLPHWAQLMYSADPDVNAVSREYEEYYASHPFEKTIHTQYYMLWMNSVRGKVGANGHVQYETA